MVINGLYIYNNNLLVGGLEHFLFGGFDFFPYIGTNNPNWRIFFGGVETTNQFNIGGSTSLIKATMVVIHSGLIDSALEWCLGMIKLSPNAKLFRLVNYDYYKLLL